MNFKKIFILSIFLLTLLTIGSVSAIGNTSDDMIYANDDNANDISINKALKEADNELPPIEDVLLGNESCTFNDLDNLISHSENLAVLTHDFKFNETSDKDYENGIGIHRNDLTIEGDNHIIDGDGLARMFNGTGSYITFQNIKFVNGFSQNGGALYITGNYVKIINCTFINNKATVDGGSVYLKSANGEIINSRFLNNTAIYNGAVYMNSINAIVDNCLFENNHANTSAGAIGWAKQENGIIKNSRFINNSAVNEGGGAIFWNQGEDGKIINSTFENNYAIYDGGAIFWSYANNGVISNSRFTNNKASVNGGAIFYRGNASLDIFNCNFTNNSASKKEGLGGAVYSINRTTGKINTCNFENNQAFDGGAVYYRGVDGTIVNSNFTNNKAYYNGAVYMNSIEGTVYKSVFKNNYATDSAGALGWVKKENGTIAYCEFTNNTAPRGGAIYLNNGTEFYIRNSIFENNTASMHGGAIFWDSGNEGRLIGSTFNNNIAGEFGGAVCWNNTVNGYISHSHFDKNQAFDGGAIYFRGSNGLIAYSDFTNNDAYYNGAIYMNSAYGEIDSCLFENNTATNSSGALGWVKKENGMIKNSEFKNNKAIDGGAIYVNNGNNMTIDNSKFIKNHADNTGGAMCWDNGDNGNIMNTLFESNAASSGGAIYNSGKITLKNNNFTNNSASDGNDNIALVYNGSINYIIDLKTSAVDNVYGNIVKLITTLTNNSKAVNNGTVSVVINEVTYDANVSNGSATIEIPNLNAGEYAVDVAYDGTPYYNNQTETFTFSVSKKSVQITAKDASYVINYGRKYSVTVKGLVGEKVIFTLNGKKIGQSTTNAKGIVSISLTAKILKAAKAGKKNLIIKLDANNYQTSKTVKITINKEKTKIATKSKSFKSKTKVKKYTISLKNSKGKAIKKVKVTLKVKGKTYKATTNTKGKATFKITKLTKKSKYKAKITFKGNAYYKSSSKNIIITVR